MPSNQPVQGGPSTPSRSHNFPRPSTPARGLLDIRSRLHAQQSIALNISAFGHLLANLNADWEEDGRTGRERDREDRISEFRTDWLCGLHSRLKPLELPDEDARSIGGETASTSQETATSAFSFVTASEGNAATPTRARQLPLDPMQRGMLAEETIKADLRRKKLLLEHEDYAPLAPVVREAVKKVLRTGQPVFVSPGLLESADWSEDFEQWGWARPGVRFGVFKPDMIRFEEVRRKGVDDEERAVSWEVIEVKYNAGTKDTVYTNWKVQALFYHLSLLRLLAPTPRLVPSHKLSYFISRDPLSAKYEERSHAVKTEQGFVEHHLFQLLPKWLNAVTREEEGKLREGLATALPATPGNAQPTFLEKLQQSVKSSPAASPGRPYRPPPRSISPTKPRPTRSSALSSVSRPPSASRPAARARTHDPPSTSDEEDCIFPPPDVLPPLPFMDEEEEKALQELFVKIGID
ncbi:hypothetical protein JCM10213_006273 [Rhodosporidiobolus nylandii]